MEIEEEKDKKKISPDKEIEKLIKDIKNLSICNYYRNSKEEGESLMDYNYNIEDLKKIGKNKNKCPFFMSRGLIEKSILIVLSYNYLINPIIKTTIVDDLANNYVVFDEAHNICSKLEDEASLKIKLSLIKKMINILKETISKKEIKKKWIRK